MGTVEKNVVLCGTEGLTLVLLFTFEPLRKGNKPSCRTEIFLSVCVCLRVFVHVYFFLCLSSAVVFCLTLLAHCQEMFPCRLILFGSRDSVRGDGPEPFP